MYIGSLTEADPFCLSPPSPFLEKKTYPPAHSQITGGGSFSFAMYIHLVRSVSRTDLDVDLSVFKTSTYVLLLTTMTMKPDNLANSQATPFSHARFGQRRRLRCTARTGAGATKPLVQPKVVLPTRARTNDTHTHTHTRSSHEDWECLTWASGFEPGCNRVTSREGAGGDTHVESGAGLLG